MSAKKDNLYECITDVLQSAVNALNRYFQYFENVQRELQLMRWTSITANWKTEILNHISSFGVFAITYGIFFH